MSSEFFRVKKGLNISPSDSSTVTSPEIGDIIVDSSDNNKLKRYDDVTSSWKDVGSGAGGINYISNNSDFEGGTVGYATYADAAGEAPVDGTGGTATFVSIGTDSVSPLRGTKSGLISKTANNAQGQGVSYDFIIDPADQAQVLRISFDYSTSANYADGDIRVYIYDYFNLRLIEVVDRDLLASAQGKFVGTFQTSPDSLSYRLIFHVASANALAYTVEIDNVIVGPQTIVKGAIVTDWEPCTVTWSGIPGTVTSFIKRVGDSADIKTAIAVTGAGTGLISFSVPTGLSVDTTKLLLNEFQANLRMRDQTGSTASYTGVVSYNGGTFQIAPNRDTVNAGTSYISVVNASATIPVTWASGDFIEAIVFGVPIQGWSSNVVLSEDAGNREIALLATDVAGTLSSTSFAYNDLNFTVIQKDTTASYAVAGYTIPETGEYDISLGCAITYGTVPVAGNDLSVGIKVNSGDYRVSFQKTTGTTAQYYPSGNWTVSLAKGDLITPYFRKQGTETLTFLNATDDRFQYFTIAKRSSPQTIAASEVVAVSYSTTAGQSIPSSSGSGSVVLFETKDFDTHNAYNILTGRFTSPSSGYYQVSAAIRFNADMLSTGTSISVGILKNGVNVIFHSDIASTTGTLRHGRSISQLVYLNKDDYIEITAQQNSGAAKLLDGSNVVNRMSICKITGVS